MAEKVDWIGIDWRDTGVRAHILGASGTLLETRTAPSGGDPDPATQAVLLTLIEDLLSGSDQVPVIACGLAGRGSAAMRPVPCPPLPVGSAAGPATALPCAPGFEPRLALHLIPGLRQDRPVDAICGPETRIAGFLAGTPNFDGVLCLPGAQSVWARISAGEVVSFMTCLTGELIDLLSRKSTLAPAINADGWDDHAFAETLGDALSRPERLAMMLCALRLGVPHCRARLFGVLIGAELASTRPYWLGQTIAIVAEGDLAGHYASALATQGVHTTISNQNMALAGLARARALLRDG